MPQEECFESRLLHVQDDKILVYTGPLEWGPNNDLVLFLKNTYNDLFKGPGPNNEFVKGLNDLGRAFDKSKPITTNY